MLVVNDLHLSVDRRTGTTPASQEELRTYQYKSLSTLLGSTEETHLLCLGDLFDDFLVATKDVIETYSLFAAWLSLGRKLTLVAGNHDNSSKGDKVSSFTLLAYILKNQFDSVNVLDVGQAGLVDPRVYAIAHCANQDLFNAELQKALESSDTFDTLLLHCNLNNTFAQQTDHSLDLSSDVAADFKRSGVSILLAHEHNSRTVGNVTVLGCQFPTSILDCLDPVGRKFAHTLVDGRVEKIETWSRMGAAGYAEVPWQELNDNAIANDVRFIRVVGTASADEASDVINAIAKFRKASSAFVITNNVKVEGITEAEDLPESFEAAKRFDVLDYIYTHLDAEETATVKHLLEKAS